jgi:hypothetical protein
MIRKTITTKDIVETHRDCDICGGHAKTHCCKCNNDLCNKCVEHEDYDWGDYRGNCYCKSCWDAGKDIRSQIEELEYKIEQLTTEWDEKCKCNG